MTTPTEGSGATGDSGSEGICELCGENPAVVHLTQVLDDQMTVLHLCKACAAEKGVESPEIPDSSPLTDFLAQMDPSPEKHRPDPGDGCGVPHDERAASVRTRRHDGGGELTRGGGGPLRPRGRPARRGR